MNKIAGELRAQYCDSCSNAGHEDASIDLDDLSMAALLPDMGANIADHMCDEPENGETGDCTCGKGKMEKLAGRGKEGSPRRMQNNITE